ncbi:hypothetical protein [Acidiferrobacter sp.]|uniref:hypothetical protein n=1 Tax=Acidiferrobacter sp. TaxID=1872107 RepID=UPI00261F552B|nr:hypothetical protein [Acidiferrobacter sp.]
MAIADLNLWDPRLASLGVGLALVTAFFLGMVHGITPDEHTWPITFNYAIGSYSIRGGFRAGLLFSAAFTLQRAIASELAYFAMTDFLVGARWNFAVYIVVGLVMAASGYYILRKGRVPHLFHSHALDHEPSVEPAALPRYMPLVHGFLAGWGTGAFAIIVYTVLAPATRSPYLAFLPGLLFGLGTMVTQMLIGSLFGGWMARRKLDGRARVYVARKMAGRTLSGGGMTFMIVGALGLMAPELASMSWTTGLHIHNLAHLGVGLFLVVIMLVPIAGYAFWKSVREARERFPAAP